MEKKGAGSALLKERHNMKSPDPVPLGQYRGFAMEMYFETASKECRLTLFHTLRHTVSLGIDIHGIIQRIDNVLDGLETGMQNQENSLENEKSQLEAARAEAKRPFPQEDELKEKQRLLLLSQIRRADCWRKHPKETGMSFGCFQLFCLAFAMPASCFGILPHALYPE